MAERVGDPTHSPAVLLSHQSDLGGTGTHGLIEHCVVMVNDEQRPACAAANGSGAETLHARARLGHPELGGPYRQLNYDVVPVPTR